MILLKIKGDFEKIKFRSPFTINETNHFIKRSCLKVNFSLPYRYLLIDFIDLLWFPEKWKPFEDFWYELTIKFQVFLISITFLNFPVALIYVKWNFTHLFFEFPFYPKKNQSRAFFHDWQCSIKLSIGVGEKLVKNLIEPESRIKFHHQISSVSMKYFNQPSSPLQNPQIIRTDVIANRFLIFREMLVSWDEQSFLPLADI